MMGNHEFMACLWMYHGSDAYCSMSKSGTVVMGVHDASG